MPSQRVAIPFPAKGISEQYGFSYQEELTCRDDRNMRTRDPRTGRLRGAQRAGLGLHAGGAQVVSGGQRVRALGAVSSATSQLSWSNSLTGDKDWDNGGESNGDVVDMRRTPYGSYIAITTLRQILVFNEDGTILHKLYLPETPASGSDAVFPSCVYMDEFQNIFAGTTGYSAADPDDAALYIWRYNEDETYKLVYGLSFDGEFICDVHAKKSVLYVATCTQPQEHGSFTGADSAATTQYYRLRVFPDYLPFNEAPVEDDDRRHARTLQTQPASDTAVPGVDAFYENYFATARIDVNDDGAVLLSCASFGANAQEWGEVVWLDYQPSSNSMQVAAQTDVSKFLYSDGNYLGTNGLGLDAQWLGDVLQDNQAIATAGDPIVASVSIGATGTSPAVGDEIQIYGPSPDGTNADCVMTLVFGIGGSGSTPVPVVGSKSVYVGLCDSSNIPSTAVGVCDMIVAGVEAALAASGYASNGPDTRAIMQNQTATSVLFLSPDPAVAWSTTSGSSEEAWLQCTATNAWVTDASKRTWSLQANVRRMVATRDTGGGGFSTSTSLGAWQHGWRGHVIGSAGLNTGLYRFSYDQNYSLYFPWGRSSYDATFDGQQVMFYPHDYDGTYSPGDSDERLYFKTSLTSEAPAGGIIQAVAVPLDVPDYGDAAIWHAPYYITAGGRNTGVATPGAEYPSIFRIDVASVTQTTSNPRDAHVIAVAHNEVRKITSAGSFAPKGNDVIDSTAPYVQVATGFQKIYISDGANYYVYDPLDTDANDYGSVKKLLCSTFGAIPQRCRLIEFWRGRLVLARDPEDPGRWSMSALGDATDWDFFPTVPSSVQAVSATNSRAGKVPDIINAVVPWSDDLLLFGGDRSIYQLTGDPMAGGVLDLVTDSTGMSFGRPYCKDPDGSLWFFGSTGGLYYMPRGSMPTRVSVGRVEKSLRSIDLSANYVQLQWNPIDEGVHIFVIPFGASGTIVDHWFYEVQAQAFHRDRFGLRDNDNIQPTSSVLVDGDAYNDRTVLLGCEDGRVRRWGTDSSGNIPKSDQQTTSADIAIDSYSLIGPIVNNPIEGSQQLTELAAVLSSSQHGCNYQLYTSDEPENLGDPVSQGTFKPGRNDRHLVRINGDHVFMRLRNASVGESWAFEGASATMSYGGELRR